MTDRDEGWRQRLVVPILNVTIDEPTIPVTDGLILRQTSESERARWTNHAEVTRLAPERELAEATLTIEQTSMHDSPPIHAMDRESEDLYTLLGLLELRSPERLRTPFMEFQRNDAFSDSIAPVILEIPDTLKVWERRTRTQIKFDAETLQRYWRLLTGDSNTQRRLRRALGRATLARQQHFAEEAILSSVIAFECLFSPADSSDGLNNNTNVVVASATEWLTDPDYEGEAGREAGFAQLKAAYRVRSDIVHGKDVGAAALSDTAKELENAVRRSIGLALELGVSELGTNQLFDRFCARVSATLAKEIRHRRHPKPSC